MRGVRVRRAWRRRLGALAVTALAACAVASPASAHAQLVRSTPPSGTSIRDSPSAVRLVFDEDVSGTLSRVTVSGTKTPHVTDVRIVQTAGSELAIVLPRLEPDLYRVDWRTVEEDDLHPTSGTITFGVGDGTPAPVPLGDAGDRAVEPALGVVAIRWLDFCGLGIVLGGLGFLVVVLPGARRRNVAGLDRLQRPLIGLCLGAGITATVSGVVLLLTQGRGELTRVLVDTSYGRCWIARELILAALVGVMVALRRAPARQGLLRAAAGLAALVAIPIALSSHAAALEGRVSVATLAIGVHMLTAALWFGGVVSLALALGMLARSRDREAASGLVRSFAGYAAACVSLVALTGLVSLGVHVDSLGALVHTQYGATLIVKTTLFVLAGVVGLATAIVIRSRRSPTTRLGLWVTMPRLEAALLAAVLAPAALLTLSAPARSALASVSVGATSFRTTRSVDDLVVSIAAEPNRPGPSFITVGVYDTRRPPPAPVARVTLSLATPGHATRRVVLSRVADNQWRGATTLPAGTTTLGAGVERHGLPTAAATATTSAPTAAVAHDGSTLEPLRRVAGAAAMVLVLVLLARLRGLQLPQEAPRQTHDELRPGGAVR
jgi:copper transport protein